MNRFMVVLMLFFVATAADAANCWAKLGKQKVFGDHEQITQINKMPIDKCDIFGFSWSGTYLDKAHYLAFIVFDAESERLIYLRYKDGKFGMPPEYRTTEWNYVTKERLKQQNPEGYDLGNASFGKVYPDIPIPARPLIEQNVPDPVMIGW